MACNVYVFEQFPDLRTGIRHAYPGGAKREGPSGLTPTYAQKRNNMLSQVKPPFRAEHIGSLLRPTALLQQRAKFARGEIDAATLGKAEDQAIKDAGRAIGRKLLGCDGARRLSSTSGEVRVHPGRAGATRLAPGPRARQHRLGAGPRRYREPCQWGEIVRRAAFRRRELHGTAQLNSVGA